MERLNRVYAVLSGINQVIIRVREPQAVFTAACEIATERGGFKMAWIGTLGRDGVMLKVASVPDAAAGSGTAPEALATQAVADRHTVVADNSGGGQVAALPFSDGGPLSGALVLYAAEVGFFGADELRILEELVGDIGFGLRFSRQEGALRASEQRFRTLFESAGDGMFLMDGDTFVACNQKTLDVFGCPRDRIIGKHPYDLSPPIQPNGTISKLEAVRLITAALAGTVQRFEWRHLRCDGTPFDAEVVLSRVDVNEKPYLQATVRDITERKRLSQERDRLIAIIESTPDYVCVATPDGTCIYLNDSYRRILPPKSLEQMDVGQGIPLSTFHSKVATELVMDTAVPHALKHGYWQGENTILDSEGTEFAVLQTIIAHTDANGRLQHFSVVSRDTPAVTR